MKPYFNYPIKQEHIGVVRDHKGIMLVDLQDTHVPVIMSVSELFSLPYSVYLLDAEGGTLKINEEGARVCGFHTIENAVGHTIFDVSKGNTAKALLDNCQSVFTQETVKIFDEFNLRHDGRSLQFLSIKFPCYDSKHHKHGTLGISIVMGEHPLASAITKLTALNLLPENIRPQDQVLTLNLHGASLTPRETECLEYTVKGFTAKEIAKKLQLSPRTVEEYINQIKLKLDVMTKQLLIQKVLS